MAAGSPELFAERTGYRCNPGDLEFTARAALVGSLFAVANAASNMLFAFRYAGGLAQYWCILVSYPLLRLTERLPRGSLLNPGPFTAKEHCLVMTIAIAGSLAGTLGLSGGMLSLNLYFDTRLSMPTIYSWAIVSGFFGLFFGNFMHSSLVISDRYEWPFSKVNAAFIAAMHASTPADEALERAEEEEDGGVCRCCCGWSRPVTMLGIFGVFFLAAFIWFPVPNYFVPAMFTAPLMCWLSPPEYRPVQPFGRGGLRDLFSVLSSGEAGSGVPGLGSWSGAWAFGPSIIPLQTTVQIVIGM